MDWILLVFAAVSFVIAAAMANATRQLNRVLLQHNMMPLMYIPEIVVAIMGVILVLIVIT
jgi:hypothetical protein